MEYRFPAPSSDDATPAAGPYPEAAAFLPAIPAESEDRQPGAAAFPMTPGGEGPTLTSVFPASPAPGPASAGGGPGRRRDAGRLAAGEGHDSRRQLAFVLHFHGHGRCPDGLGPGENGARG